MIFFRINIFFGNISIEFYAIHLLKYIILNVYLIKILINLKYFCTSLSFRISAFVKAMIASSMDL